MPPNSPPPEPRLHAFGLCVRRLREDRGLSVEELARRSDLSFRGLLYIEHGRRNPGLLTVFKIAEGLGIGVAELFTDRTRREGADPAGR